MPKIKQLPLHEIQKISAGEVVDRPANIVKELIENSLDAGATRISIIIKDGGKESIRIIDNGCGMSEDDARLCILHHTTSKITTVHDLSTLTTFGFRGEALSSITAVSECRIITKEAHALAGICITTRAGTIVHEEVVACQPGTDITIDNIFYNIPARKKFLKTTVTEWRAILQLVQAYCLAYPSCHFSLQHDDNLVISCGPATTRIMRLEQLFGSSLAAHMLEGSTGNTTTSLQCTAFISNPQYSRYDRSMFFLFVNQRWIKNTKLAHMIMQAYENVLPPGKFPIACLFIEINPEVIDINVHPRKEEIKFLYAHKVEQAIKDMINQRLNRYRSEQLTPHPSPQLFSSINKTDFFHSPTLHLEPEIQRRDPQEKDQFESILNASFSQIPAIPTPYQLPEQESQTAVTDQEQHYTLIGQLHTTYLLLETPQGLVLIDQHAAHERILYEQFAQRFQNIPRVALIFPLVITLSDKDSAIVADYKQFFAEHSIIIDQQGEHQFVVSELPVHTKEHNIQELIHEVIGWIHERQEIEPAVFLEKMHEKMHSQMACKAAVKAGDELTQPQMHELITKLYATPHRLTCPHGRPTSWLMTRYEIEKIFKRKR